VRDVTRIDRIGFAARRGSAFVCGSERQRDMWLGFLAANRRLNSDQYEHDTELRTLIDVVPFGVPREPPQPAPEPVVRGTLFPEQAQIMVWNGGLWDWMDPLTPIRAIALLRKRSDWRLVFHASARPSHRAQMTMAARAQALAAELGLLDDDSIYFRPGWTPYAERGGLLLESDIGISAHPRTLEARFAHRARMLDFFWARLPILCTEGNAGSEEVAQQGLGETVPAEDPEAFAAAAERIVGRGRAAYEPALAAAGAERSWDRAAQPLLQLIEHVVASGKHHFPGVASVGFRLRYSTAAAAWKVSGASGPASAETRQPNRP
jgi:glycosyltransferase involved in cell wall biosynthesis